MRRTVLLSLLVSLFFGTPAEARLLWQTYGSVMPNDDGCGSTWNWNQDYFVPRHASSGRYGLFSPCKTSRTTSPACKWCHPFYSGYCSIYGPCHYKRRDHVYKAYCGSSPQNIYGPRRASGGGCRVPYRRGSGPVCGDAPTCGETTAMCPMACRPMARTAYPLPNVEVPGLEILGSISVEGDGLLANINTSPLGEQEERVLMGPKAVGLPELLNSLGLPGTGKPLQILPSP